MKKYIPIIVCTILILPTFFFIPSREGSFFTNLNQIRIVAIILASYLIVFNSYTRFQHYQFFKKLTTAIVPLIAIMFIGIWMRNPNQAVLLILEDQKIEAIQAILIFMTSAIFFITSIIFLLKKHFMQSLVLILGALIFFVIGMEEISWMQRILEVETSEFFHQNNIQKENNFHNLNTSLTQNVYYFGAFILFVVLPHYSENVILFLKKTKFSFLEILVPQKWILLPFCVTVAFIWPTSYRHPSTIIAITITIFILLKEADRLQDSKEYFTVIHYCSTAALIVAISIIAIFRNTIWVLYSGAPTEYMETLISLGLFVYSFDFFVRTFFLEPTSRILLRKVSEET